MLSFVKLLKVALPVATTTAATIATTFLVSFGKQDPKHIEENIDKGLDDFQKPSENFEDKKMYYSTKGEAEGLTKLNDEQAEEFAKRLKEQGDEPQEMNPNDIPEKALEGMLNSPDGSDLLKKQDDPSQNQELNPPLPEDINKSNPETKDLKDSTQNMPQEKEGKFVSDAQSEDGASDDLSGDQKIGNQDGNNDRDDSPERVDTQNSDESENGPKEQGETSDNSRNLEGTKEELDDNQGKEASEKSEANNPQELSQPSKELDSKEKNGSTDVSDQGLNENMESLENNKSKGEVDANGIREDKDQESGSSLDSGHGTDEVNSSPHVTSEEELETLLGLEAELALVKSGLEGMLDN